MNEKDFRELCHKKEYQEVFAKLYRYVINTYAEKGITDSDCKDRASAIIDFLIDFYGVEKSFEGIRFLYLIGHPIVTIMDAHDFAKKAYLEDLKNK